LQGESISARLLLDRLDQTILAKAFRRERQEIKPAKAPSSY
jgi:hypothetical protein